MLIILKEIVDLLEIVKETEWNWTKNSALNILFSFDRAEHFFRIDVPW